jgi:hypothetical protein
MGDLDPEAEEMLVGQEVSGELSIRVLRGKGGQ